MPSILEFAKRSGNEALSINAPTNTDFHLTSDGSDWLWAAFCVFLTVALIFHGFMLRKPVKERPFYYTSVVPAWVLAIAYFTYASDLGWTPVQAEFNHVTTSDQSETPGIRQVFYTKFIGWFLAFPFPIINLGLLSRTPGTQIAFNVFFTEVFVVCFLVGALVHSSYKWGYFSLGVAAYISVCVNLFVTSRRLSLSVGKDCHTYFVWLSSIFCFLWFIYPIAWGICEGGNVIQPDSEAVFYGVLDVVTFAFYPFAFFFCTYDLNLERLGLIKPDFEVTKEKAILSARTSGETAIHRPPLGSSGNGTPTRVTPTP